MQHWLHGERNGKDEQWLSTGAINPFMLRLRVTGQEGYGEEIPRRDESATKVSLV